MRFDSTAGQLRTLLSLARQSMATTPSLLAYTGVQLSVDGDIVQIVGSDGETTTAANGRVTKGQNGSALVLPRPLTTFLSSLPADCRVTVSTTEHGDELVVTPSDALPYRFRTLATTFPQTPLPQGETREVDFSGLAAAVNAVRSGVARENPVVQLVSDDNGFTLHSTDNYRLVRAEVDGGGFGTFTGVLPLTLLDRLAKMEIRTVTVDGASRLMAFASPQAQIVTRVLAVPFPAVDAVLSSRPANRTTLPSKAVIEACNRLASISDTSPVRCQLDGVGLTLEVNNADLGSGRETVTLPEEADRQPIEFLVRLGYLSDAVVATGADAVDLFYTGPLQPLFVSPAGSLVVTTVVMPVRA